VNAMRIVRAGKRGPIWPEVNDWMDDLGSKVEHLKGEVTDPVTVKIFGQFRDGRHPDNDNLFKACCDGLKKGLSLDDKFFIPVSEGHAEGYTVPGLRITLEWEKNLVRDL